MLQTYFKKDGMCPVFVAVAEGELDTGYEVWLFLYQTVPYFLPFEAKQINGRQEFTYRLGYKTTVKDALGHLPLTRQRLEQMMSCMIGALESAQDYLLDPERILWRADSVFLDAESGCLQFCYCPVAEPVHGSMKDLVAELLVFVEKRNEDAVLLILQFYHQLTEPDCTLEQLKTVLQTFRTGKGEKSDRWNATWQNDTLWPEETVQGMQTDTRWNEAVYGMRTGMRPIGTVQGMQTDTWSNEVVQDMHKGTQSNEAVQDMHKGTRSNEAVQGMPAGTRSNEAVYNMQTGVEPGGISSGFPDGLEAGKKGRHVWGVKKQTEHKPQDSGQEEPQSVGQRIMKIMLFVCAAGNLVLVIALFAGILTYDRAYYLFFGLGALIVLTLVYMQMTKEESPDTIMQEYFAGQGQKEADWSKDATTSLQQMNDRQSDIARSFGQMEQGVKPETTDHKPLGETVVLMPQGKENIMVPQDEGHLCLQPMEKDLYAPIVVNTRSVVLGCMPESCNYVLTARGISRMHAKIMERADGIYLLDLNSTNGTYLNGEILESGKDYRLEEGDMVAFARCEFYVARLENSEQYSEKNGSFI
ncbi:MAG: FHA domain-containing protein [Lachnospiraceae bacterium]|nr:FHA domain-containing protein [Lachnospiraceae bacterium]